MAQSKQKAAESDEAAAPQPLAGSVISPGQTVSLRQPGETAPPPAPKVMPAEPIKASSAKDEPQTAPPAEPKITPSVPAAAPEEPGIDEAQPADETEPAEGELSWTASEFMAHDKSAGWYVLLLLGAGLFAAAVYLLTKDVVSTGVVIVAAIILAIYGSHQPQEQQYTLDAQGIGIGSKRYDYDMYKSFAVASEGAFSSLVFMPLKRFAVPLTIYYAPEDEERIITLLGDRLPMEKHRLDAIDHLMRRLRF